MSFCHDLGLGHGFLKGNLVIMEKKIFISYDSGDENKLMALCRAIATKYLGRFKPIVVADRPSPNILLADKVKKGIEEADYFMPIITRNSIRSQWVNQEIGYATARRKTEEFIVLIQDTLRHRLKGFIHRERSLPFTFTGCRSDPRKEARSFRKCYEGALTFLSIEPEEPLTSAGLEPQGKRKRAALVILEPREEEVFTEYVEISGTGARPGSTVLLVTSLYGKYLAPQKGCAIADRNGDWQHPKCHLLNIGKDRLIYALGVAMKNEDRVRQLLQRQGKKPVNKAMDKFKKLLKSRRIPFKLSPAKRLKRQPRIEYGITRDFGDLPQFEEQSKLVDVKWPEKSGQVAQAAQRGFELRWSRPEKVETRRFDGWDTWYEVDKVGRVKSRLLLEDGSILIARRKNTT